MQQPAEQRRSVALHFRQNVRVGVEGRAPHLVNTVVKLLSAAGARNVIDHTVPNWLAIGTMTIDTVPV
jgi:hypothetical protein